MLQQGGFYVWPKGEDVPVGSHFRTREYTCPCHNSDCNEQKIAVELVRRNDAIRDSIGMPLRVTSGYRCHKHQLELAAGGLETATGVSQHELGNASDLTVADLSSLPLLAAAAERLFDAIGVARFFVHVDLRGPHADGSKRKWTYTKS